MSRYRTDRVLCIDLEMTCWDGPVPEGMRREIIEVGLVEIDMRARVLGREARHLVRPVASEVSEFCTSLTGLTPEEVSRGRPLQEVMRTLVKEFGPGSKVTLAWGEDWSAIDEDCRHAGIPNPFPRDGFVNIGRVHALLSGSSARPGLHAALTAAGLDWEGREHSALDDARNTARMIMRMGEVHALHLGDGNAPESGADPGPGIG